MLPATRFLMTISNSTTQANEDVAFAVVRDKFHLGTDVRLQWARVYVEGAGVLDFTGSYIVSNVGKVYSLMFQRLRELAPKKPSSRGYLCVGLQHEGQYRKLKIHRIIACTFLGMPEEGYECCHIDGTRTNNEVNNLRWGTPKENMHDQKAHGTTTSGERQGRAKLSNVQAQQLLDEYDAGGITQTALALKYGVAQTAVGYIVHGDSYISLKRNNLKPLSTKLRTKLEHVAMLYERAGHTLEEVGSALGVSKVMANKLYNRALVYGIAKGL